MKINYDFTDSKIILKININVINEFMEKKLACIVTGRHFDAIHIT